MKVKAKNNCINLLNTGLEILNWIDEFKSKRNSLILLMKKKKTKINGQTILNLIQTEGDCDVMIEHLVIYRVFLVFAFFLERTSSERRENKILFSKIIIIIINIPKNCLHIFNIILNMNFHSKKKKKLFLIQGFKNMYVFSYCDCHR